MKRKIMVLPMLLSLALAGCSLEPLAQEEKDYYLVVSSERYKQTESMPEGKCPISLRGKHSLDSLVKTAEENKELMVKNNLESTNQKTQKGCIDDFTKQEVAKMQEDQNILYIQFAGNQDPFGAYAK